LKKSAKVLLTGSSGFIGCNLKSMLVAEGHETFEATKENGFDLSMRNWSSLIPKKPFDYVIHLAQSAYYRDFPDGACDMMRINLEATFELLEWNRKHCAGSFLFASTGTVYGQKPYALTEKDVAAPSSFYGATKLCAEHLIEQYQAFFPTHIMRLFGVYGPGQKSMVIINLIEKILRNKEIVLANGIGLKFNPLFVEDCSRILCGLIKSKSTHSNVLNVAGKEVVGLGEVVEKLGELLNVPPRVTITQDLETNLVANIEALEDLFPAFEATALDVGLGKTCKWVQDQKIFC
tara:strand:- start:425 stop:1297 length:873 start_codon:yes stop_codon:yes gene_type:complete